jgi:hypothetical protein
MPQRGLIVIELILPEAEAEAAKRQEAGRKKGAATTNQDQSALPPFGGRAPEPLEAIEDAAKRSQGLVTLGTLQRMAPVRDAPETQERIRSGEIKTAAGRARPGTPPGR